MAQAVQVVQFSIIGIVVLGDKLFPMLGMQTPAIYEQVKDKKFAVGKPFLAFEVHTKLPPHRGTVIHILKWDQTLQRLLCGRSVLHRRLPLFCKSFCHISSIGFAEYQSSCL
ncbi:TPA: hypothetical protein ACH3X2_010380 [Trebouxia sp. C0005]